MSGNGSRKIQRQNKMTDKTVYHFRLIDENYDFLIREAEEEGISVAAMLNRIVSEKRRSVPRSTFATP